jgi:hypothetical protein
VRIEYSRRNFFRMFLCGLGALLMGLISVLIAIRHNFPREPQTIFQDLLLVIYVLNTALLICGGIALLGIGGVGLKMYDHNMNEIDPRNGV